MAAIDQNPMSEERLEIIETIAHRQVMPMVIEACHEIRRLQARVAELADQVRRGKGSADVRA